jgi:hypothetical protein
MKSLQCSKIFLRGKPLERDKEAAQLDIFPALALGKKSQHCPPVFYGLGPNPFVMIELILSGLLQRLDFGPVILDHFFQFFKVFLHFGHFLFSRLFKLFWHDYSPPRLRLKLKMSTGNKQLQNKSAVHLKNLK